MTTTAPFAEAPQGGPVPGTDALVTATPGLVLRGLAELPVRLGGQLNPQPAAPPPSDTGVDPDTKPAR